MPSLLRPPALFTCALAFSMLPVAAVEITVEMPVHASPPAAAGAETPRRWSPDLLKPLTAARVESLPEKDQAPWRAYLAESERRAALMPARGKADQSPTQPVQPGTKSSTYSRGAKVDSPAAYFQTPEAQAVADAIVSWQSPTGGWSKGGDYTRRRSPGDPNPGGWANGTFDNNSTTTELRFLARAIAATGESLRAAAWMDAFSRGLDYVFAAQYPNGGFPQIYPLVGGYHDAVTFNDGGFVHVLEVLKGVASAKGDYAFVPAEQAKRAATALERGIQCVLQAQLRTPSGKLLVWCQQHDALTLAPHPARNFEMVAVSTSESADLARFLMTVDTPSPEIIASVEAAVAWFEATGLKGVDWDRKASAGTGLIPRADAPPLWARFYDLQTGKPVFGERDRTIHFAVTEVSEERRRGYSWFNTSGASLPKAYASWKKRISAK